MDNNDEKQSSRNLFYIFLEVAGVVHAGEWVASQKLVASPVARPLIEALDYAQRTNTIGSLKSADVCINWAAARHSASELASVLALHQFSRSITAPMALAQSQPQVIIQENKELKEIIARLSERLDEPFVTVNTVTGNMGIQNLCKPNANELARFAETPPSLSKQAQDEYQRLMNNKTAIKRGQFELVQGLSSMSSLSKSPKSKRKCVFRNNFFYLCNVQ